MQSNERSDLGNVEVADYLVEVPNAKALDLTLRLTLGLAARVVGAPEPVEYDGRYRVRVFGDARFFLFVMKAQGYCTVLEKCEDLA